MKNHTEQMFLSLGSFFFLSVSSFCYYTIHSKCEPANIRFYLRTKRNALCVCMGIANVLVVVTVFFLCCIFLVFHSRGRYITFDAVKLESIFHCTHTDLFHGIIFTKRTQSVLSMNVARRERNVNEKK